MQCAVLRLAAGLAVAVSLGSAAEPAEKKALTVLRGLPVRFEPNRGQWDARVKFSAAAPGYRLVLEERGATLALSPEAVIGISLAGARRPRGIEGLEPLPSTANFFLGARRENWRTGVPQYSRVRYRELYPGIDLVYYGTGGQLEFDFVLRPGADPRRVRIEFRGAGRLSLTAAGDLLLEAGGARFTQKRPLVYQQDAGGARREVAASYRLLGRNVVGVELGRYDSSRELTIDPVLTYASLLGTSGSDAITAMQVDKNGQVWVAGFVTGTDITAPDVAYQTESKGGTDAFVARIDPNAQGGSSLTYFTYLGGSGTDMALGLALDDAGSVYLTGSTDSTDFPLAGSTPQSANGGGTDAFVVKLVPSLPFGDALFYSTYLGGGDIDKANGIAVDAHGGVYIVGTTRSDNLPATDSAFQKIRWGAQVAFVAKLVPDASPSLAYLSYLGGELRDNGRAIAVTPSGTVYVAGTTMSTQFAWAGNPYRITPAGPINGFVSQFDMTKSGDASLVYSTYIGGSQWDEACKIAVDAQGKVLVAGFTMSPDFPTTANAYQTAPGGNGDVFLMRVDPAAPPEGFILYSTLLGGADTDVAYDLAPRGDNVTLTGYTLSSDFPVTSDALQAAYGGGVDVFVTTLNLAKSGAEALQYSTFLGGLGINGGNAVAVTADGTVYLGGLTAPQSVQAMSNGAQTSFGGGISDGFLVVLKPQ